eukprot:CAMPEP_0176204536 /NCGR_PEP_ID=MMETSP0121_2-20121125/11138_1 /TAXON_ID=160619 /ORGANISM="Kryptoperidinium foliaceum, Strain CCMP 1326" /LENGTH=342 /DNA_ID=CAMNT_0017543459 /DNA_START=426 /DNA_END=1454 /DNA_ORIENTATION=-
MGRITARSSLSNGRSLSEAPSSSATTHHILSSNNFARNVAASAAPGLRLRLASWVRVRGHPLCPLRGVTWRGSSGKPRVSNDNLRIRSSSSVGSWSAASAAGWLTTGSRSPLALADASAIRGPRAGRFKGSRSKVAPSMSSLGRIAGKLSTVGDGVRSDTLRHQSSSSVGSDSWRCMAGKLAVVNGAKLSGPSNPPSERSSSECTGGKLSSVRDGVRSDTLRHRSSSSVGSDSSRCMAGKLAAVNGRFSDHSQRLSPGCIKCKLSAIWDGVSNDTLRHQSSSWSPSQLSSEWTAGRLNIVGTWVLLSLQATSVLASSRNHTIRSYSANAAMQSDGIAANVQP